MLGRAIWGSWPLLLGMLLLMLSNGLLATLLTLRATEYGFSDTAIGLMQSAYPVGAILGCMVAPRIVAKVGHIRTFGALASLCSITALVHLITADPISWSAMRALAGFCFPGLYVVAESWLNGRANNDTRATLLSVYFVIQTGGAAGGQLLLSIPDSSGLLLFVLVSILISLSLVPMLISAKTGQEFIRPERISLHALFKISPLGFSGSFLNGIAQGAFYIGLGLYGVAVGLSASQVGFLIGAGALGGMVSQFPIGALSDRMDRRIVIAGLALLSLLLCLGLAMFGDRIGTGFGLFLAIACLGGLVLPIYSLCVAHTNDYLQPNQIVPASGALVLVLNAGVILGPTLGALAISTLGPSGLFVLLTLVQVATASFALYRLSSGRPKAENQRSAAPVAYGATAVSARLNPEAGSTGIANDQQR